MFSMNYKTQIKMITWNVRGLNEREKRLAIRQTFFLEKPNLICLQETKLRAMNANLRKEICGRRLDEYRALDSRGTKGGILIAWQGRRYEELDHSNTEFCLSITLKDRVLDQKIKIVGVYGPSRQDKRQQFFEEVRMEEPVDGTPWLICGDFNTMLQ